MDRIIVFPTEVPLDTMFLDTNKNAMVGLGWALQSILGTGTLADGLGCGPTTPASLAVLVAPGAVYALQNVDGTAYGSLDADTARQVVKQGLRADAVTLATPAPATAGQSVVYLIQAAYADQDVDPVVLPYYNAADPDQAFNGPNGTGVPQNTVRKGACLVNAKAGVAGVSPTAPAPDAGYVGLYTVTVANGQSTVTAPNISLLNTAPFIAEKLTAKISKATADTYYGPQHGQCKLWLDGTSLRLSPYNGNKLFVDGAMRTIPTAGVTIAPTGLSANTTYYIYARMNAGAVVFDTPSATAPAPDAATGVMVKAGDATRTLVGMARTTAATAWADTEQQRFVLGWFNRQALRGWNGVTSAVINSGTAIELDATKRVEFLSWGDATVYAEAHAYSSNTGAGNTNWMTLDTLSGTPSVVEVAPAVSVSAGVPVSHASAALQGQFVAGYNAILLEGYVSAGMATYVANAFVTVFG